MKFWTRDREAGNKIECFETLEEAQEAIKAYEEQDKNEGSFENDFYEIYEENSKRFELKKASIEVSYKDRLSIAPGVAVDEESETIAVYDNLEDAKKELEKYSAYIRSLSGSTGSYYLITEYFVEEIELDEDDDFVCSLGIHEYSKMEFNLIEKPSYNTLAKFDNMRDAEEAYNAYDGDNEVYIEF